METKAYISSGILNEREGVELGHIARDRINTARTGRDATHLSHDDQQSIKPPGASQVEHSLDSDVD